MRTRFAKLSAAGLLVVSLAAVTIALSRRDVSPFDEAVAAYRSDLSRFDRALATLSSALAHQNAAATQQAFRETRTAFKRIELFAAYYGQFAEREINGPPLYRAEDEDPETPLAPAGLQVVEADLFPTLNAARLDADRREIRLIRTAVARLAAAGVDTMPGDAYLFDAMRQELARVATLGLGGFDVTTSGDAITEAADAVDGVARAFEPYRRSLRRRDRHMVEVFDARIVEATRYLRAHRDFERFDRLAFIAEHVQPLAHALAAAQRALAIGPPTRPRAWSARAASVFDRDAFDPMFFAAFDAPRPAPAIVALGRDLFFDQRLSPSRQRSCASCHDPNRAFTDGQARAALIPGRTVRGGGRNTPTLVNAALQPTLFDDGRVRTLEDQATDVLGSAAEMGGSLALAASTLSHDDALVARFASAFTQPHDRALRPQTLRFALAAYVRSLVGLDSRFDRALRGESSAMSQQERDGFNLFMGKARCGTCHFAPLFNGATPPSFTESEPEVIGVPATTARPGTVDPDSGRFNVRRIDLHLFAFKTPTLRNIELTAPYMHNGVFRTLDEVVDFYDGGGGHGLGIRVKQTLPTDSLQLSANEKRALVAFMRTLTGTGGTSRR